MQVKSREITKLGQLVDSLNTALLHSKRTNLLAGFQRADKSPSSHDAPILRDQFTRTILSFRNFFQYIRNSLNFLEDRQEPVCDFDKLISQIDHHHQYSENEIKQLFRRAMQQQEFIINQRKKTVKIDYVETLHFASLNTFSILVQNSQNRTLNFKIEGNKKGLLQLKEGKVVPTFFISNFFKILKLLKKIDDDIQVASLMFLPSLLKDFEGQASSDSKLSKTIKANFSLAISHLQTFILSKDITVIPLLTGQHYSMIIVKKINIISLQFIYCSSQYTLNRTLMKIIALYLKVEMEKNPNLPKILDKNISYLQLLLPKHVRCSDSGLYLILYSEILLTSKNQLENLDLISKRYKLHIFPRSLGLSMRQRVWNFYMRLTNPSELDKGKIIQDYFEERKVYSQNAILKLDYDQVEKKEIGKLFTLAETDTENAEERYSQELEFYYSKIINYYEQ